MAHRLLRHYGPVLGLGEGFSVLDQSDSADLMRLVRSELIAAGANDGHLRRRFPRADTLISIYSRVVNAGCPLRDIVKRWYPWCGEDVDTIGALFARYTARKRSQGLLDFDDLLLYWRAAACDQETGAMLGDLYDHILVDEYQDTNAIQAEILQGLRRSRPDITVVGDDAQAIYSFRSATVRNIFGFERCFPGSTIVTLEENYRSTQPILDLANAVIRDASEGYAKRLWARRAGGGRPVLATCPDERAQSDAVCGMILDHYERGVSLRSQVVLFRSGHHSDALEVELRRRRIPFVKYGGLRFLEAAHVRDLLAALRVLDNPWDELAWHRLLLLVDGVGPAIAGRLADELGVTARDAPRRFSNESAADPLARFTNGRPFETRCAAPTKAELASLAAALADCRPAALDPAAQVDRLRVALDPMLRRRYEHAEARIRDLDQLGRLAQTYPSRDRLVAELTLDPPASTGDFAGPPLIEEDYLTLSTVHSAKGGEWQVVHVIHAADGMFPSDMATGDAASIDEERRLFYVALTRARGDLYLYSPLRYHHRGAHRWGDRHSYAQRTRFLPPAVDGLLEHRAVRGALAEQSLPARGAPIVDAVDDALRSLW
jgi:DNA helicase-2/ATP-dependent DNA helicase PcrA